MKKRRKKGKITEIVIPKEVMDKIPKEVMDKVEKGSAKFPKSETFKHNLLRRYIGKLCSGCEGILTKMITWDKQGADLIERYCNECFKKHSGYL